MDDVSLAAAALADREFTVCLDDDPAAGGRAIDLRTPVPFEVEILALEMQAGKSAAAQARLVRALLDAAVIGWRNITAQDIVPSTQCADPHPFSAASLKTLLDTRHDIALKLRLELLRQINESGERVNAAKKS